LRVGVFAKAVSHVRDDQYEVRAIARRRSHLHVVGRIIARSDSSGECFLLRYSDGSEASYEPDELIFVAPPTGEGGR
jgi:hypothetical protein